MTSLQPGFLVLLVAAVFPWFVGRRDWRHALLRSLTITLLVLALARPAWLRQDEERGYLVYVHEPVAASWIETQMDEAASGQEVSSVVIEGSFSEALEEAVARIPLGSRGAVTVVSSGASTDPHWGQAVRQLQERGIPLHTLALPREEDGRLKLLSLAEAQPLRVGQAVEIWAELLSVPPDVEIQLVDVESQAVLASHRSAEAADRLRVPLEIEPPRAGFVQLALRAGDEVLQRTFAVEQPLRVLYLSERVQEGEQRLQRLLGEGMTLVASTGALPGLEGYDLVMLDDLPAPRLSPADQERLLTQVEDRGLGLVMSGGMAAFGPGGYDETPMAKALPVEFMQKEEKRDPSTTLAVIIDTSGSMGGERVQLAKEVARLAIRRLLPHDKVGIVEFYGTKQWAAPIQSAANAIDIQRALNRLDAGGGTVIMPAIEEAYYAMQNVETRYKHVLVLTDGGVEAGEFEPLLRKMAGKGMNVSTVLVGGDAHSEFLVNIANWGKGHFYSASNRFSIPEILLKQPSTSKIPAYRPGVHRVTGRGGRGWWGEVSPAEVPALNGYVETRPREGAEVLLETTANRHPVLATWKLGLGRVTALTTEPAGKGTGSWMEWEGYGPWLARVLARTAREERQPFAFSAERRGTSVTVRARKLVAEEIVPRVAWEGAGSVILQRRAPDVFSARLTVDPEEEGRFWGWGGADAAVPAEAPRRPFVSNAEDDVTPEPRMDPEEGVNLQALAEAAGGSFQSFDERGGFLPVMGGGPHSLRVLRLWSLCLLLALLCYLADLVYRRWPNRERS